MLNFTSLTRLSVDTTSVSPIANANSPLSGRNKTATPASSPVASPQPQAYFARYVAVSASVAVKHIATARNMVGVSVRIVAT